MLVTKGTQVLINRMTGYIYCLLFVKSFFTIKSSINGYRFFQPKLDIADQNTVLTLKFASSFNHAKTVRTCGFNCRYVLKLSDNTIGFNLLKRNNKILLRNSQM